MFMEPSAVILRAAERDHRSLSRCSASAETFNENLYNNNKQQQQTTTTTTLCSF
ncbi:hypothetical protein AMELA_G00038210 [Ameiurus melas]|uniref:Uncharacterized protein n=1 Tax=Ameiurus melas TaxID=219545 RepID=A0A7J6BBU8_AMEME|nr:hypothetical protein AMELA_G00038210 [Ameiurus melas]